MSHPILVTGITGQIGGELAKLLVAADAEVRGLTRDPSKARMAPAGTKLVQGDLEDPSTLGAAFAGADRACFVASAGPRLERLGTHFLDAAKRAGVRHVVIVSSAAVLIEPRPAIGRWHLELETRVEASGLAWTILRPGPFASNAWRWAAMIRSQGTVFQPYGDARTAPIDPRDIASVAFSALTTPNHEGKRYTLTGPELVSVREQVHQMAKVLGKSLRFVDVPEDGARKSMLGVGMPEIMVDGILELIRANAEGRASLQTTTVREVTGREARTFNEWVRDHAATFA
jgi:uncharacterized protein YbjT (DUF2867 family)